MSGSNARACCRPRPKDSLASSFRSMIQTDHNHKRLPAKRHVSYALRVPEVTLHRGRRSMGKCDVVLLLGLDALLKVNQRP
jgi:hypothetical protein